ncbi:MAG: tyrosine-type recombinase/integrase [Pseudomonadota bacterium]
MPNRIDTVTARGKLKIRREPYWHRLSQGVYVGYRKMSDSSDGAWQLRHRREDGNDVESSLGTLDTFKPHERFDKAVEIARQRLASASNDDIDAVKHAATVMDACDAYVKKIEELKGAKPADDLADRYRRWVKPDPIQDILLTKMTREHINGFRRRLAAAPVVINKAGDTRIRSKDTVNRDMAAVRAALNQALSDRLVTTDFAWREPLKAYKNVSKRKNLYLDLEQRRRFIRHAPEDLAAFLRGMSMLPLRPGALAALKVEDFDSRFCVLRIGKDKSGQDRNIKLPPEFKTLFDAATNNRPPSAPLLARADGQAWHKDSWKGPLKDAARAAGLPRETTAYTLRHSVISDLVHGGLDLLSLLRQRGSSSTPSISNLAERVFTI